MRPRTPIISLPSRWNSDGTFLLDNPVPLRAIPAYTAPRRETALHEARVEGRCELRLTYGVLSYLVTQCRREIGIRMALGAGRETVLRSVIAHGLTFALIGLAAGLAVALLLTRLMEALLFEVRPNDPATLAGVPALITVVAAAASLVPAFRATRVDPIAALREE